MARIDFNTETNGASISIDSVKGPSFSGVYAASVFPVSPVKFGLQISAPFYQNVWNKNEHQIFINGVDKTSLSVTEICDLLRSVFTSTGGGGMSAFGTLSSLAWDGSNALLTLTANAAITLTPGTRLSGILHVVQGGAGNYTLSINGVSFAINTAVGSQTGIGWYIANNKINFSMDAQLSSSAIPVADTTPPTVTLVATSPTNIQATFNESSTVTLAGWSFKKNGSALVPTAVSGSGTVWNFTVPTISSSDTLLGSYNSATGATVDSSNNELASFTDAAITYTATIAGTTWFSRKDPSVGATTSGTAPVLITALNDLSGLYPWSVPGGTAPEYQANGFGTGKAAIKLDTNKSLGTATYSTALAKPYTRIAVVKFNSMPAAGIGKYFFYSNSPSAESNASIVGTGGNLSMWAGPGAPLVATGILALNTTYVIWLEYAGGSNDKVYLNNVLKVTGNAGSHINMTGERIGEVGGASADCLIGDVLIYAGIMSAADRTSIYNELAAKYGI